jgi:PAS domain S-box-containing protein
VSRSAADPSVNPASRRRQPRLLADRSLRVKLTLVFLALMTLSVAAVAFFSARATRAELTTNVGANLHATAQSSALAVGDLLARQVDTLQAFGLSKVVQDGVAAANAAYAGAPDAIQARISALDQQWIAAGDSDPLIQTRLTNDVASELREYHADFADNVEVLVTDRYGALVGANRRTSDLAQADEDWWRAAWNAGRGAIHIGQPAIDASSDTLALVIAVPLYAHNTQHVIGVLRTTYRLDKLAILIHSMRVGQSGSADLVLPEGRMLAQAGDRLISASPELLPPLQDGAATYAELAIEGRPSLVSQARVVSISGEPSIANLNWILIVHQDRAESLAPVTAAVWTMLITVLIALLCAGILAFGIAQAIGAPIERLTDTAQLIAAGDLRQRLTIDREDEIGQLARSFNAMVEALEQRDTQLRDAEARYRALVEHNPGIIYIAEFGALGRWHYVSPQITAILGFAPDEWLAAPNSWYAQLHADDRERVLEEEARSYTEGVAFRCEYRMYARDGRVVWVRDEAFQVRVGADQPPTLQGVMFDITDRRRAEAALLESHNLLRAVIEGTADAIFVKNLAGRYIMINSAGARILGIAVEAALGKNDQELFPHGYRHGRHGQATPVRAIFHHQRARARHRPGAGHMLRDRPAARRLHLGR